VSVSVCHCVLLATVVTESGPGRSLALASAPALSRGKGIIDFLLFQRRAAGGRRLLVQGHPYLTRAGQTNVFIPIGQPLIERQNGPALDSLETRKFPQ
jgi:hypothetical protein